ncbi:hypothetical protein [Streptomyces sp. NEAU-NA10]|uniref:hypothetical protein n=1 Tax=Streptomyces sp. NEAU-NA10 TaxID=3416050 RepID=UPI003CC5F6E5
MELATAWIAERYRRWPDSTNPYLIVSRETAVDDLHRPVSSDVIHAPFRKVGLRASELRPVTAAHPDKRADPIQA